MTQQSPNPDQQGATHDVDAAQRLNIALTALELLDTWGPVAVTPDLVSEDSGVSIETVLSLAGSKDHLIDLACDQIYAEVDLRPLEVPWPEQLRHYSRSFRQSLLRHSRAALVMAVRPIVSESSMAVAEQALTQLTAVGFTPEEANRVLLVIVSFVTGHVLTEIGSTADIGGHEPEDIMRFRRELSPDKLPLAATALANDPDRDAEFELGLKLITDGLERRLLHAAP